MKLYIWMFLGLLIPQSAWGATANITKVESKKVTLDIGATRGIVTGMKADILTNTGLVVHPVTGEDYGNRRVKIGEIEIVGVSAESSIGRIDVAYGPINVGDMVDGLVAIPSEQERMQMDIDEAHHADVAKNAGAAELPPPVKVAMKFTSKLMTRSAYWI